MESCEIVHRNSLEMSPVTRQQVYREVDYMRILQKKLVGKTIKREILVHKCLKPCIVFLQYVFSTNFMHSPYISLLNTLSKTAKVRTYKGYPSYFSCTEVSHLYKCPKTGMIHNWKVRVLSMPVILFINLIADWYHWWWESRNVQETSDWKNKPSWPGRNHLTQCWCGNVCGFYDFILCMQNKDSKISKYIPKYACSYQRWVIH